MHTLCVEQYNQSKLEIYSREPQETFDVIVRSKRICPLFVDSIQGETEFKNDYCKTIICGQEFHLVMIVDLIISFC